MSTSSSNSETPKAKFSAHLIQEAKDGGKDFWQRVATVFPHKDGEGFDVLIPEGMALSGRVVIRKDKPRDNEEAPN